MPTQSSEWIAASRLVRRTGFGSTGAVVDDVVAQGSDAWLAAAIATDPATDEGSKQTPVPEMTALVAKGVGKGEGQRKAQQEKIGADRRALTNWWLRRMATATQPLPERLTFAWHDHFATSLGTVRLPSLMLQQNVVQRDLGRGDFRELALAMLTDAAMLRWLDGQKSTAKAPNENLAREFMELFALGEGDGYTEDDVKEGARALTGWTVEDGGSTVFVAKRHDKTSKTVLGVTGDLDTEGFCDAVLARPESPKHIARRLWRHLVSPDAPDDATLAELTGAYGEERDISALLTRMLGGPEFAEAEGSHVTTPIEWAMGAVRALKVPLAKDGAARTLGADLRALGQIPFYPPSVAGWPVGQAWLSTAAAAQRIDTATRFAKQGDISTVEDAGSDDRLDAAAYLLGIGGWSDRSAQALRPLAGKPVELVTMSLNTAEYLVH